MSSQQLALIAVSTSQKKLDCANLRESCKGSVVSVVRDKADDVKREVRVSIKREVMPGCSVDDDSLSRLFALLAEVFDDWAARENPLTREIVEAAAGIAPEPGSSIESVSISSSVSDEVYTFDQSDGARLRQLAD